MWSFINIRRPLKKIRMQTVCMYVRKNSDWKRYSVKYFHTITLENIRVFRERFAIG